jgi:hypothetical protein
MGRYEEEVRDVATGLKDHGNMVVIEMAKKTQQQFDTDVKKLRESLPAAGAQQAAAGNRLRNHLQSGSTGRDGLTRILDEPAGKAAVGSTQGTGGVTGNRLREHLKNGAAPRDSLSRILD